MTTYDLRWEASVGTLVIVFFNPLQWANLEKLIFEILAWSSILAILLSNSQTTVVILKITMFPIQEINFDFFRVTILALMM